MIKIAYHRNGISGEGFHVILFDWKESSEVTRRMQAVVFKSPGHCAVFDTAELANSNIEFAKGNSWRGDHFESDCRTWIAAYQASQ